MRIDEGRALVDGGAAASRDQELRDPRGDAVVIQSFEERAHLVIREMQAHHLFHQGVDPLFTAEALEQRSVGVARRASVSGVGAHGLHLRNLLVRRGSRIGKRDTRCQARQDDDRDQSAKNDSCVLHRGPPARMKG